MPSFRPVRPKPLPRQPVLRPKRALVFILLAVGGLGLGAGLARLSPHPPFAHPMASLAWEGGMVVVRPADDHLAGDGLD